MASIEIQTTQNVTIEYELASLRDRIVAMLIDAIIFSFIYFAIIFLFFFFIASDLTESSMVLYVLFLLFPIIGFMGYHFISELVMNGQSWGKKAIGIKVVRLDEEEAGLSSFLLRSVFHIIDTFFSMGIIGAILISSSQNKQRLGDLTSNTTVVKFRSSSRFGLKEILKINTLQHYEPIYSEVRHFKESDMLIVKNLITRYRKYPNLAHQEALRLAAERFTQLLDLKEQPNNYLTFLETLLKDYVVLTR